MTDPAPEERAAISAAWMHYPGRVANDNIHKDFRAGWAAGRAYERERSTEDAQHYRAALERIRALGGKVCLEYEGCRHPACESSIGAWMEADKALARRAPADPARAEDDGQ